MIWSPLNKIRGQEDTAMAKAQRYSLEQVRAAQKKLRGLAVKNAGKTRAEVVGLLAGDIRKAAKQGYSPEEIREILAQAGIPVSLSRMKDVLGKASEDAAQKVGQAAKTEVTVSVSNVREAGEETIIQPEESARPGLNFPPRSGNILGAV
jgi:alkylhydroperoxidase/carboxymuconolactone decarboxylase family protein YurZ